MVHTDIDLSEPSVWADGFPDEVFADLRANSPVHHHAATEGVTAQVGRDFWIATKHSDVTRVHRDHESFTATDGPLIQDLDLFAAFPTLVNMDPPDVNKRRKIISSAFTPRAIARLEDGIRDRARSMTAALLDSGGGDFVDLADGLPMSVIGDIVGIPHADRERVFGLLDTVLRSAATGIGMPQGDDLGAFLEIFTYATELTADKRANPVDDIWSTMCAAQITDDAGEQFQLQENELEIFFFVLSLAGSDTSKNALCDAMRAFTADPAQADRYRDNPDLRKSAVEEVLRFSTPIIYWVRGAAHDVELGGQWIEKGSRVVTMLRSANRDSDVFDDPMSFDIGRDPNSHVAFGGGGAHHCLGAMLARAEIRAVLDELLLNTSSVAVGEPTVIYPNLISNMTMYDAMPIDLTRR